MKLSIKANQIRDKSQSFSIIICEHRVVIHKLSTLIATIQTQIYRKTILWQN
jgi:hypothetical protein